MQNKNLTTICKVTSDYFIAEGYLIDNDIHASYYVTFSSSLGLVSDWADSSNSPSQISNFVMMTSNIAGSTTIINQTPFNLQNLRFINIKSGILILDDIYFYDSATPNAYIGQ